MLFIPMTYTQQQHLIDHPHIDNAVPSSLLTDNNSIPSISLWDRGMPPYPSISRIQKRIYPS
jgi:hypothetical protein